MKLRATLVVEYDANAVNYGTTDPVQMAAIDAEHWTQDPALLTCSFEPEDFKLTVEPVTEQASA